MKTRRKWNRVVMIGAICLSIIGSSISTSAADTNAVEEPIVREYTEYEKQLLALRPNTRNLMMDESKDIIMDEWETLKECGRVSLDGEKQIVVNGLISSEMNEAIRYWNIAISCGLLDVDTNTFQFFLPAITEETIERATSIVTVKEMEKSVRLRGSEPRSPHCGLIEWDVAFVCYLNHTDIWNYYCYMSTALSGPYAGANAWLSTVSYWVAHVKENGPWDYKVVYKDDNDGWLCCIYHGQYNVHKTAEWFGNYNYGYTGKLLFSLDILHEGSAAIQGDREVDMLTDWPAIDEGYADAP